MTEPEDPMSANLCETYWGSHGCQYEDGHDGPHVCVCCVCGDAHPLPDSGCVGASPYYGADTEFYQ